MEIIEVTDLKRPELVVYAELSERQLATIYEPKEGLFIAESPKVIERALDGGYEPVSFLAEKVQLAEAEEILKRVENVPIYVAPDEILTKLTGYHLTRGPQSVTNDRGGMSGSEADRHSGRSGQSDKCGGVVSLCSSTGNGCGDIDRRL